MPRAKISGLQKWFFLSFLPRKAEANLTGVDNSLINPASFTINLYNLIYSSAE
jgi:hypothetical protein